MQHKILSKDSLAEFIEALRKDYTVYAPKRDKKVPNKMVWKVLEADETPTFEFVNTDMSPKDFVFPQSECMMRFKAEGKDAMVLKPVEQDTEQRVLLNVRPCDGKGLSFMDMIFCQDEQTNDVYWRDKRERTVMIGLACNSPCPSCFCLEANCGPHHEVGLDILMVDLGVQLLLKPLTERGKAIAASLPDASEADVKAAQTKRQQAEAAMKKTIDTQRVEQRSLMELYNLPYWERVCETCINCGTCTFVCPTCHCFDIQDEVPASGGNGRRVRNWDFCMAPLFTLHTSGHNPRGKKIARVRQRFMHKYKYIPMKRDGEVGCVGCGRCVRLCPVNIDIRDVINAMNAPDTATEGQEV
ncbi:4Fe-4S dicluster domain-containing protein [Desulfovibrio subterraneus]|uniref:4Fe-4S dicluster domain-containing protein n=1 Tax=Desulfovibrio subterraneus TaxID=2718620 RepID=UPI0022B86300|nr:4Fe-4S dicluster domain-containing protein [Desulfovibrio subterraneus]WBF66444.1 4Fe-4S dicluster domain-containing protein [Desulfovibrio subterraneus]